MSKENLEELVKQNRELEKNILSKRHAWEKVRSQLTSMFDSGERFFVANPGAWGWPSFETFPDTECLRNLFKEYQDAYEEKINVEAKLRKLGVKPDNSPAWQHFITKFQP